MKPIFIATDETPLERTPLSFASNNKGKSSDTLIKSDDITTQGNKRLSKVSIKNVWIYIFYMDIYFLISS